MALLTKVKTRLAIHARRPVSGLLDGQYASLVAGRSLDFSDLREYLPGDDVADIDWKASARHGGLSAGQHGGLLVKRYVADRKHTVVLVVDTGRELSALATWDERGGTRRSELALLASGLLGWVAVSHGDHVGLVCGAERGPTIRRPSVREVELERMLTLVESGTTADAPPQDTTALLEFALAAVRRRTIMFLVLGDVEVGPAVEDLLRRLLVRHEVAVLTIADLDPTEPGRHGHDVRDVGTGRPFPRFAAEHAALATEVAADADARAGRRAATLTRLGVAHAHLDDPDRVVLDVLGLLAGMRRAR